MYKTTQRYKNYKISGMKNKRRTGTRNTAFSTSLSVKHVIKTNEREKKTRNRKSRKTKTGKAQINKKKKKPM